MESGDSFHLPKGDDLDLLLVGKSGNGKMSAGNAILGRNTFMSLGGGRTHQVGYSQVDGRVIKVVDVLGFCHQQTCAHSEESATIFTDALSKGIGQFPTGIHAIVFVVSFTKKFTKEEVKVIHALKEILGDEVIRKYGICLVTHGDCFHKDDTSKTYDGDDDDDDSNNGNDNDDDDQDSYKNKSFLKWCKKQKGYLREFFEECQYRCILFDSVTSDDQRQKKQRVELVSCVDKLEDKHTLYTLDTYMKSKKEEEKKKKKNMIDPHDHAEGECKLPMVLETIARENSLIQEAVFNFKQHKEQQQQQRSQDETTTTGNGNENELKCAAITSFINFNPLKIKTRADYLLHEMSHHDPEKLAPISMEIEEIRKIMAACEIASTSSPATTTSATTTSSTHSEDNKESGNRHHLEDPLVQGGKKEKELHNDKHDHHHHHHHHHPHHENHHGHNHNHDHAHSHDGSHDVNKKNRHEHGGDNNVSDDDDIDHHSHSHPHSHQDYHHHHDEEEGGREEENDDNNFDTSSLDEAKVELLLATTEKVKVKLVEIREKEEEYHSWIYSSVTSPVRHLINTAFPSVVEGVIEVADFVMDTLFD